MKKRKIILYITISFLFLLITTKCSPLYQLNDWYDANAFFTVGKSMVRGVVPYLNLFEQKGPVLFLIYGIASLISIKSFIGVFILEVISYTIFLYYIDKIICLLTKEQASYILLPILSALILSSRSFTHGGSCEEFTFPFLACAIYYFVKYLKTNQITNKETLVVGITAGIIFWMKYTILGFHLGFCLIVFIKKIQEKDFEDLLQKIKYFLGGFLLTTIPWLIYFSLFKDGIKSLIDTYFLFNIMSYAEELNIVEKIINCIITTINVLLKYPQYILLVFLPIILSFKTKTFFKQEKNNQYLLIATTFLLIFLFLGGTNFRYYSLPLQPFMIFGLIYIYNHIYDKELEKDLQHHLKEISLFTTILCLLFSLYQSPNVKYLNKKKEDYAQYQFAKLIKPNETILNYGFLDGGFYFTTNQIPNTYYFQRNNVKDTIYPQITNSQRQYIKEKKVDYVITKKKLNAYDKKLIEESYTLIATHTQNYEEKIKTYHLYKRKDLK